MTLTIPILSPFLFIPSLNALLSLIRRIFLFTSLLSFLYARANQGPCLIEVLAHAHSVTHHVAVPRRCAVTYIRGAEVCDAEPKQLPAQQQHGSSSWSCRYVRTCALVAANHSTAACPGHRHLVCFPTELIGG